MTGARRGAEGQTPDKAREKNGPSAAEFAGEYDADLAGMSCVMLCGCVNISINDADDADFCYARIPFLWLNQAGVRFADESISGNFSFVGGAMSYQKEVYSVLDEFLMRWIEENGNCFNGAPANNAVQELQDDVDAGADGIWVADPVEELAVMMGLDPAVVSEAISAYNKFCKEGYDQDFGKTRYLLPLSEPPYYGLKLAISYYTTVGGL